MSKNARDIIARGMAARAAAAGGGGGGSGGRNITITVEVEAAWRHLSETWQTIHDYLLAGNHVMLVEAEDNGDVSEVYQTPILAATYDTSSGQYLIHTIGLDYHEGVAVVGYTTSPDDYPTMSW